MDNLQMLVDTAEDVARLLAVWTWQALLLLAGVWLILKLERSRVPFVRHQVWLLALLAVAALPLLTLAIRWFPAASPSAASFVPLGELPEAVLDPVRTVFTITREAASLDAPAQAIAPHLSTSIWSVVFVIWVSGALITAGRICRSYWYLHRGRSKALPITIADLGCDDCDPGASSLRHVSLGLSPNTQSPVLIGVLRPMILLPADIRSWTTAEERTAILRHEVTHLERWDHYVNFFQAVLNTIFFFHPLIRYASNQLSLERELACDERVLAAGTAATTYVSSLLKVAERNLMPEAQYQPASFATKKTLERRVKMILNKHRQPNTARRWPLLATAATVIGMMTWLIMPSHSIGAASRQQQNAELVRPTDRQPTPLPAIDQPVTVVAKPSRQEHRGSVEVATARRGSQKSMTALAARTSSKLPQTGTDEQAIRTLLREAANANVKNDVAVLDRFIAEDYVSTGLRGEIENKAQALAHFKAGDHKYEADEVDDLAVRVFDNTAVATYIVTAKGKYQGADFNVQNRNTTMFVKRQGRWQAVADQRTRKQ